MSPRSEEFMAEAKTRLAGARAAERDGFGSLAVGAAYYAMLPAFLLAPTRLRAPRA